MMPRWALGKIDGNSHIPKYIQLKEIIVGLINSGAIAVGESIPSLSQLKLIYKVSDTTCKKAIAKLVHEGILRGEWGKGVFVQSACPRESVESITLIVRRGLDLLGHPAFSQILRGVIEKTVESNLYLEFIFLEPDIMSREEIWEKVSGINSSGVLIPLIPYMEEDHLEPLKEKNIPVVFMNRRFASISPYMISYGLDRPVHQAVRDMLRRGRKKIALVGSPWDAIFGMIKRGADRALDEVGMKLKDEMVLRCPYSFEAGRQTMEDLLKRGCLPDAVIADDEYVAYGVLDAVIKSGLSVPHDMELLAVGGFLEKVPMRPKLPTVRIPLFDIGFKATEILMDMIAGRMPLLEDIIVDSRLDDRQAEVVLV